MRDRSQFRRFAVEMSLPNPDAFLSAAEFTANARLRRALTEGPDVDAAEKQLREMRASETPIDEPGIGPSTRFARRWKKSSQQMIVS